ncbi:hypothetical protein Tco_1276914 [Tanacetum coccineum]
MEKSNKRKSVSKQGRKSVKSSKAMLNEAMDYTLAQDEGKTDSKVEEPKTSSKTEELHLSGDTLVVEDKRSAKKGGSTKGTDLQQSTVKPDEGTDNQNRGTDRTKVSTDSFVEGTTKIKDQVSGESDTLTVPTMTSTPTPTVFGDDETIAQVLVTMSQNKVKQKEKEKGVELKNVEDERVINDLNKKDAGIKKAGSIKKESKEVEDTSEDDETNSEKENDELRLCLTIAPDEDKEVDYEILDKNNGQRRYFYTLMRVLSIFDRDDLSVVYQLVMDRYKDEIPEGFDRVLWGDLMIMFNPSDEDEFWNSHQDWNVYPLRKKVLVQMLELKLESEKDNTMALELIRFFKKLIAELEPENSDGDEKDL